MKKFTKNLLLLAIAMLLSIGVYAQGRGNLSGYVKDESGSILPGAAVFLKGTTLGTSTDMNGAYTLQGVPAGDAEISVTYLGYNTKTVKVKVKAGVTGSFNIIMSQLAKSIEGVTVTAIIDGQQRALNQQMQADNLISVISADQIGLFPDLNVGDALKRVSGVTSDGSKISLRGTPSSFTNINIDGEQLIGTGEGGDRAPSVDLIPSDVLASIEVQKTILPSSDGDAIGGIINLRSSEARSLKAKFNVDLGTGVTFLRDKAGFNGKIGYSQRYNPTVKNPNGTWGLAVNYSYNQTHGGKDRVEATAWVSTKLNTVNNGSSTGDFLRPDMSAPATEDGDNNPYKTWVPSDFRYRYENSKQGRQGATMVLDWAPSMNTKFVLTGGYNNKTKDGERWRNRFRFRLRDYYWQMDELDPIASGSSSPAYENAPEGGFGPNAIGANRMQNVIQYTETSQNTDNYNVNLSGQSVIGNWKIDGSVAYSYSIEEYRSIMPGFMTPQYRGGDKNVGTGSPAWNTPRRYMIGYIPDITTPFLTMNYMQKVNGATAGVSPTDLSRYYMNIIDNWDYNTSGRNVAAQLNSAYSHFIGTNSSTLQFGVKGKFTNTHGWIPSGMSKIYGQSGGFTASMVDPLLAMSNYIWKDRLDDKFAGGNLSFGYAPSGDKIKNNLTALQDKLGYDAHNSERQADAYYFDANEHTYAAYAMEKIQFKKVMALVGVRVEHNRVNYKANEIFRYDTRINSYGGLADNPGGQLSATNQAAWMAATGADEWSPAYDAYNKTLVDSTMNYTMVLPNIQLKWDISPRTILRAAYTTGYSRPNAINLVPKQDINTDLNVVTIGNPDLKAAYSHNVDILFERFLSNVGILSGGVFYKSINNFHFMSQTAISESSQYAGSPMTAVRQYKNGKRANVYGAEVTVNSALTFLPGFLENLVFTGNYTYVHSKANVERMPDVAGGQPIKVASRLPGQANSTANIALAYSSKRFTIQASYNYMGSYIVTIGPDPEQDVWLDGRWQLDVNGSVNLYKGLSFYVEAQNILNQEYYQYFGAKNRVYDYAINGVIGRCGFSYKF